MFVLIKVEVNPVNLTANLNLPLKPNFPWLVQLELENQLETTLPILTALLFI